MRQTAILGFTALCLPPKTGIFQGINDWESFKVMNNIEKVSGKWIFTIFHHTRYVGNSALLWGSWLKQAEESTKEYFEASYSDGTETWSINWSKMVREQLMENIPNSTHKNNDSHAAPDLRCPKTASQKWERYTSGRFFYMCNVSYLHRFLSQAGCWARRTFNQIQYPSSSGFGLFRGWVFFLICLFGSFSPKKFCTSKCNILI